MRIYLSAIETCLEHCDAVTVAKAPSLLTSFYYARKLTTRSNRYWAWRGALGQATARMIDSGAHTLRVGKAQGSDTHDYDVMLDKYIEWVRAMQQARLADVWVEFDIGKVVGERWVAAHRQKIIRAGLGSGLIQVWHPLEHTWRDWEALVAEAQLPGRSRYVAIEGNGDTSRSRIDYTRFIDYAYKRDVRVHGFRCTSFTADLIKYPFYSTDSTSWIAPTLYGCGMARTSAGWLSTTRNAKGQVWRGKLPKKGSSASVRMDLLRASARHWVLAEQQVTEFWRKKGIVWK